MQSDAALPARPAARSFPLRLTWPTLALITILLVALALRIADLQRVGDGNAYYTAAIKSMLQSPINFFFAVAEPGGSVTVDKPPVGLWVQALFGAVLGVNGFTVTLPSVLAGVLSVGVLYHLVRRRFGVAAGLIAAFVLAVWPSTVAVDRTNNLDSLLILTLLLAAWAFIRAAETGKLKHLLIGAILIGVGFNIKMLQAFLIAPAFFALYFLAAPTKLPRKIGYLFVAGIVMLAVSLSWVLIVDLTPAANRPYVGSSQTNSALELAIGYNGLSRIFGDSSRPQPAARPDGANVIGGGGMFGGEIGTPGLTRLFTTPLANEVGWLLPYAFVLMAGLAFSTRPRFPIGPTHAALIGWGGWLLTGVAFFTVSEFYHAYYLATIAPPLAAVIGIGTVTLWQMAGKWRVLSVIGVGAAAGTVFYQGVIATAYSVSAPAALIGAGGLVLIGAGAAAFALLRAGRGRALAFAALTVAVLVMPTYWGGLTASDAASSTVLPSAYGNATDQRLPIGGQNGQNGQNPGFPMPPGGGAGGGPMGGPGGTPNVFSENVMNYLQANTEGVKYLVAVSSSMMGSGLVLQTGRPVLYMGGFSGSDPIHTPASIAGMVERGELRFILTGGAGGPGGSASSEIDTWVTDNCKAVTEVSLMPTMPGLPGGAGQPPAGLPGMGRVALPALYDCKAN